MRDKDNDDNFFISLEEQRRKVFHLYKCKLRLFKIIFGLLIALGSIYFFSTLLPYIYTHIEKETISQQQTDTVQKIDQLNSSIKKLKNGFYIIGEQKNIFKVLNDQIIRGPEDLRLFAVNLWLPNLSQTGSPSLNKGFQECSVKHAAIYEWLDCNVRAKIQSQLDGYKQLLYQNITLPVLMVGEELLEGQDKVSFKKELVTIQQLLIEKLDSQKKEIKSYPQIFTFTMYGNAKVNILFNQMFLDSWSEYEHIIGNQSSRIKDPLFKIQSNLIKKGGDILSYLEDRKSHLQKTLDDLVGHKSRIEAQSKQSISPFQNIVLIKMIPLYPMSLALGFLVSFSFLRDTYYFRRLLYQLCKKRYSEDKIIVDDDIIANAPLWVDPLNLTQNHMARSLVLLIPFLYFSITLILLLYIWFFIPDTFNLFSDATSFSKIIYGTLYTLSVALFFYSFLMMIKEYNQYP